MIENVQRVAGNSNDESMSTGGQGQVQAIDQTHETLLPGCSPIPLANYLKALGILRLVAEQVDPSARGYWRNDAFLLVTHLAAEALQQFFLDNYVPTPILAPWNGGSGFYAGDNRSGIDPIENGLANRFAKLRDTITTIRTILQRRGLEAKPEDDDAKVALLSELRGELSDDALDWLDAVVLLTDKRPKYPPLLGTGGNDGRLDFTNNFMQRLVAVIDPDTGRARKGATELLRLALFAEMQPGIPSASIGQFAPGMAGGPNQTAGFAAKAFVNPWDFILMLEGALLFAAAATRRLEHGSGGALSYPFTVRANSAGFGSGALSDEADARAEIWMPLWEAPSTLGELKTLLAEGRVTLGRRPARDALDFARAVVKLGVERGISGFQRYAFLKRYGKNYFATPLNRFVARRNRFSDIIDELESDGWLGRFRQFCREHGSARFASLVRRLEEALFALTETSDDNAPIVQQTLIILGETQRHLAASPKAREFCSPVPVLSQQWAMRADDGTLEFDLAAALASLHGRSPLNDGSTQRVMPMRAHLAPEKREYGRFVWDEGAEHQVTWGAGGLESNLIQTLQRRLLEAEGRHLVDKPFEFDHAATLTAIAAWLDDAIDGSRLAALVPGLMLARIPATGGRQRADVDALPAAYRLLKPFFCTDAQLQRAKLLPSEGRLPVRADLVRRLAADRTADALDLAMRRLRASGIAADLDSLRPGTVNFPDGRRLLTALLVPIVDRDLGKLLPKSSTQE